MHLADTTNQLTRQERDRQTVLLNAFNICHIPYQQIGEVMEPTEDLQCSFMEVELFELLFCEIFYDV